MNSPPAHLIALAEACAQAGLDAAGAQVIYQRSNVVYRLARQPVVVRLRRAPDPRKVRPRLAMSVKVTTWLHTISFPAVRPLDVDQPVAAHGYLVTFWHFFRAAGQPWRDIDGLGHLLRDLHDLPAPPFDLPACDPFGSVREDAAHCAWLTSDQRSWLLHRAGELHDRYATASWMLGCGLIHGDAHAGNLIHGPEAVVLCDWDAASYGPREQDLIPTQVGYRYGRPGAEWARLCEVYQVDPSHLPGLTLLEQIRELRALARYLRTDHQQVQAEVTRRITDLRTGTQDQPWTALDLAS